MLRKSRLALAVTAALVTGTGAVQAAQITWTGPATGGTWDNGNNWATSSPPGASDWAYFNYDTAVAAPTNPTVAAVRGSQFTLSSGTLTVSTFVDSNGFVIDPGATLVTAGADRAVNLVVTANGTLDLSTRDTGVGYLAGSGTVTASSAHTLVLDLGGNKTNTFSGSISGNVHVSLRGGGTNGSGRQVLTGANSYTAANNYTEIGSFYDAGTNVEVQLAGGDNRLPTATWLLMGAGTSITKAKLILGDASGAVNQTVAGLYSYAQSGSAVSVVGGSASMSKLTIASGSAWDYRGVLGGSGTNENNLALGKSGAGTLTLYGINTYAGDTTIAGGTLALADNAALRFVIGDSGVNNKITGAGTTSLAGDFTFDLTGAGATSGDSWTIVDSASKSFAATFSVIGFTDAGSDTWVKPIDASKNYVFSESTGVLTVVPVPEPAAFALLALGGLVTLRGRRRA